MEARPRGAGWLLALPIGVFQVVGSFGAANSQPDRKPIDALALVLVILGPLALARRDRWPVVSVAVSGAAAIWYVGAGYPFGPVFISVAMSLFSAVQAGRRRAAWTLSALGYAAFIVALYVDPQADDGPGLVHLALVAGWLVVVLAVSDVVRTRREQLVQHRQRRLSEQRLHLAQELHDVLAHNISQINVQASVALHLLDQQPDQARPALAAIKAASRESLQELRTALDILRRGEDAPRVPAPGLADLDKLVAGIEVSGLAVHLERGEPVLLPAGVELAAYRIVQEALTNVTRHAHARTATVRIAYDDGVTVEVTDDGIGGAATAGNGIVGMRERAAALGGSLDAGPRPGGGFRVVARLPERHP